MRETFFMLIQDVAHSNGLMVNQPMFHLKQLNQTAEINLAQSVPIITILMTTVRQQTHFHILIATAPGNKDILLIFHFIWLLTLIMIFM